MTLRVMLLLLFAAGVSGCSTLPASAPTEREFVRSAENLPKPDPKPKPTYQIIDLDPQAAQTLAAYQFPGLAADLGKSDYKPSLVVLPGDLVSITIFDVSAEPLLGSGASGNTTASSVSPITGHSTALPNQVVELGGAVKIPYAGLVKIAGLTPSEASRTIERALKGQMKAPQAIVSLVSSALDAVTVGGDVERPGMIPLTVRGERILDVIATAGGAKYESYDCDVQLVRHRITHKDRLQDIVDHPEENVIVEPGDSLYILRNPKSFSVLGSSLKVAQINFDSQKVTLAEAVARAGGPIDTLANIQNIYLLRYEPRTLVEDLDPTSRAHESNLDPNATTALPVAYRLDLRQGSGYFIAQAVQIRDKDVILVTKADAAQLQQIFQMVRSVTGIYFDVKSTAVN